MFVCFMLSSTDPALGMGIGHFEDWLGLLVVPQIDRTVLATSHKTFKIYSSDPVDSVLVAFEDDFCLFLCLPSHDLFVKA